MGEYSYILEQQGKTTSEKLAEFTAAIGWRDELATYRIAQDEYEMRAAAAAEQGISLLDEPPYTAEELAALDAESAAYYDAFAANYVATAAFSGSGSGTQSDPYIITNRAQLEAMADDLTAYYQLGNDIDLGGSTSPWTSIGKPSAQFKGTLDGNGFAIANAYMREQAHGIIGEATGATVITKVAFQNVDISNSSDTYIHAIAHGWLATSRPTISYCSVSGSLQNTGLSAYSIGQYTNIHDCWVDVDIRSVADAGITGTSCVNVYALGSIQVSSEFRCIGGILGSPSYTGVQISNCVALYDSITYSGTYTEGTDEDARGRILGSTKYPGSNNYASTSMRTTWSPTPSATGKDGLDVDPSTYHTQVFWETTLGWDFDTVWYWDDTEQLPKLRAFLYTPKLPLNVEIGSPQYTTVSQINYSDSTTASVQVTPSSPDTTPVSNSYYTFQSQDGQYWMTAYVGKWTNNGGIWTADIKWSSSNTDSLPAQSICWCIWAKEYYDSLIPHPQGIQNVTAVYSPISDNNDYAMIGIGTMILPMVPGVTYSGQLRCAGYGYNQTLRFMDAGFKLISEATMGDQFNVVNITIPDGTKCAVIRALDSSSNYRRAIIYPHTVTYQ